MDATSGDRSRWRRHRRRRRHRRERSQSPDSPVPSPPPSPTQRSDSLPTRSIHYGNGSKQVSLPVHKKRKLKNNDALRKATQASLEMMRQQPLHNTESLENKMGLPPPYEQSQPNPAPPPSYFGDNPPPPAGFIAPAAAPRTTVITTPPAAGPGPAAKLGPGPTGTTCASCNRSIVTRVDYVPNNRTHIVSAALCVLAGCCCGCFVPYCMRSCKTANHYCPKCRAFVGSYTPS